MTEQKRYYEKNYDELYYIFDSKTLSEKEFEKKVEYDDYDVFTDSLTPKEVVDLLNENEGLKHHISELQGQNEILTKENEELKERIKQLQINNTQRLQNEIEMLKTTIARNEAYIQQLTKQGEWRK